MPEIARFYGIVIKIYFRQQEHNLPHFHAIYSDYMGAFDIGTLEMLEGDLPLEGQKLVRKWAEQHQNALLEMWNTQQYKKLPPLK